MKLSYMYITSSLHMKGCGTVRWKFSARIDDDDKKRQNGCYIELHVHVYT